jgi:hypothetical protein
MTAFLVFLGLAALLIVGGVRGSVRLRPYHIATGQRVSGLRQSYAAPMNDTTEDKMTSHYYRKAWIILILIMFSVIIFIIATLNAAVVH